MKSLRFTLLSSLTLALLGTCFTAGLANAQGLTGKFTLPCDARWGLAALPAGDYSFHLDRAPAGWLHLFRGTRTIAMIYAQGYGQKAYSRAALLLVNHGATNTVREMRLAKFRNGPLTTLRTSRSAAARRKSGRSLA